MRAVGVIRPLSIAGGLPGAYAPREPKQTGTGVMGGKQLGFSDYEITTAKKQTNLRQF